MTLATSRYGAADTRYVAAFDPLSSPARLHLALALSGVAWSPRDRDRLTVLDIGCGRAVAPLVLAAANPGWDVVGLDLQPVHIAEATELAEEAGLANARFLEADLAEIDDAAAAALLPKADIVFCRGLWTWVPDVVRQGILALLRSRLKPGGIVVMGYNALPGYAPYIVLQRLLQDSVRGLVASDAERAAHALGVLEGIRAIGSPHLPPAHELDAIVARCRASPAYMAHQWFTDFWRPVFQAELARDLAAARLDFAGPAHPALESPDLQLRPAQQAALAALPAWMDAGTRQDVFLVRRFRTDIYVRGRRSAAPGTLGEVRFALAGDPSRAAVRFRTEAGVAALSPEQEQALLRALATGPQALADLAALPALADLTEADIAMMLIGSAVAYPLWRAGPNDGAAALRAARCNAVLARALGAEAGASGSPLGAVSPVLGAAVPMAAGDLDIAVALQAGVPAAPEVLAAALAAPGATAEEVTARAGAIAQRLSLHLEAWRALGVL